MQELDYMHRLHFMLIYFLMRAFLLSWENEPMLSIVGRQRNE